MVGSYIQLLRQNDEEKKRKREQIAAEKAALTADIDAFNAKWQAVFDACFSGDKCPNKVPDLTPLIALAKALRDKGWHVWLPELAEHFAAMLDDPFDYRPGQVFFIELLTAAGKPRATAKKLSQVYESFMPVNAPHFWRTQSAKYIAECIATRVDTTKARQSQQQQATDAANAKQRVIDLQLAARNRPALQKQLYAVKWKNKGLGAAAIRDRWNSRRPSDPISDGRAGRHDVLIAASRGRAFLEKHDATIEEVAAAMSYSLD